jgi:iron complex outermembrane receptor protein
MVKSAYPLLIIFALATPCAAKELSEADFLGELPVVLTASRLVQPAQDAPSAISVIDRAMIEASGFQTVPDLLRLVPGFYVGQVNGFIYSVANAVVDEFPRHMQVLVDGRSIYLPSVGGVRWDTLPLAMADIDRIEVVRGPDAASYGANAYTGIINIITRHPAEVEGRTLSATWGAWNDQEYLFRWAGGESNKHRITLGWRQNDGFELLNDSLRAPMLNYYGDFDMGPGQGMSLQLGYVGGTRSAGSLDDLTSQPHDERINSHFLQLDYQRDLGDGQELLAKAYHNYLLGQETVPVDPTKPVAPGVFLLPGTYTRDLMAERWHGEVQWNRPIGETVRVSLGGYGRRDSVNSQHYFNRGDDLNTWSWGVFSHAEWRLTEQWLLNAGAMWEDHDLVGGRLSPRVALNWQPSPRHTLRFAASRAYRNPVQFEMNADWKLTLPTNRGLVTQPFYTSNAALQPERNLSSEIGYLGNWPEHGLSVDARLYKEDLHDFIEITGPKRGRYFSNVGDSRHEGADGQLRWRLAPHSFVMLNYAYLHIDSNHSEKEYFPPHVGGLLLSHRFPQGVDVSLGHYRSDAFHVIGAKDPPRYRRTDVRIAKEFKLDRKRARLALVVQHVDRDNYEYDLDPDNTNDRSKLVSRLGYLQFQLDF